MLFYINTQMKKKYFNSHSNINENLIINKFLKKLNFNKSGTFNFNNDGAFLKLNHHEWADKKILNFLITR